MRSAETFLLVAGLAACDAPRSQVPAPPASTTATATASTTATATATATAVDEAMRACSTDDDCVHLGDFCGGGCAVTVNKKHREDVLKRLRTTRDCNIDCPPVKAPVCKAGRCESPPR